LSHKTHRPFTNSTASNNQEIADSSLRAYATTENETIAALTNWTSLGMKMPDRLLCETTEWIKLGMDVTVRLMERTSMRLQELDRQLFKQYYLDSPEVGARCRIQEAFDEVLLEQAKTQGPSIFLSHVALRRMHEWFKLEPGGPVRLEELAKQFASGSEVRRGVRALDSRSVWPNPTEDTNA